ncbi:hypothetical protein [Microbulbifer taiwanensis]|uniref:SprT-like domain-containing protein n=1 Tax=Microbulbifer taiwanensis TaxID=986746 RepID=A0ABW1YRH8_9GAMM|nr:hypothetical protein [Microbulbifer taiwanensis]
MDLQLSVPEGYRRNLENFTRIIADVLELDVPCIELRFKKFASSEEKYGRYGHVISKRDGLNWAKFLIEIEQDASLDRQMVAICHELIHVQQYASGRLNYGEYARSMRCLDTGEEHRVPMGLGWEWEGIFYPKGTPYLKRPWEIDAYKRQNDLMNKVYAIYREKYPEEVRE